MTSRQLIWTCVLISLCVHWLIVQQEWERPAPSGGETIIIPATFDLAVGTPAGVGLAMEQGVAPDTGETEQMDAARRLRSQALKQYFAKVREAVERRKFPANSGDLSDLIGNVHYRFRIQADDSFTDIRLVRSSGNPRLDKAAEQAIRSASGVVKRPNILRGQTWVISLTVKYQYAL